MQNYSYTEFQNASIETPKYIVVDILQPLIEGKSWVQFLSILNLILQGLNLLTSVASCWGVLFGWVYVFPIISSISALSSIKSIEFGLRKNDLEEIEKGVRQLGFSIRMLGISTLICLILFIIGMVVAISLVAVFGVDVLQSLPHLEQINSIHI